MEFSKIKTENLIEIYVEIEKFIEYLEKEKENKE